MIDNNYIIETYYKEDKWYEANKSLLYNVLKLKEKLDAELINKKLCDDVEVESKINEIINNNFVVKHNISLAKFGNEYIGLFAWNKSENEEKIWLSSAYVEEKHRDKKVYKKFIESFLEKDFKGFFIQCGANLNNFEAIKAHKGVGFIEEGTLYSKFYSKRVNNNEFVKELQNIKFETKDAQLDWFTGFDDCEKNIVLLNNLIDLWAKEIKKESVVSELKNEITKGDLKVIRGGVFEYTKGHNITFIYDRDKAVGYCAWFRNMEQGSAYIAQVFICKEYRNKGIFSRLIQEFPEIFGEIYCEDLYKLDVVSNNNFKLANDVFEYAFANKFVLFSKILKE